MKKNNKFLWPFVVIYLLFIVFFAVALGKIFIIQTTERDKWLKLLDKQIKKNIVVYFDRGNIYSSDGKLMASSMPEYTLYMDTQTEYLLQNKGANFYKYIALDSLPKALSEYFQDRTPEEYRQLLLKGYNKKSKWLLIYPEPINHDQLKVVQKMPLFNRGKNQGGLTPQIRTTRKKPYGSLAVATIGDIYQLEQKNKLPKDTTESKEPEDVKPKWWKKKKDTKSSKKYKNEVGKEIGRKGLEEYFNDVLTGKPGLGTLQKIASEETIVLQEEPESGCDIVTTIDVKLQDIAETALLDELHRINAAEGCVVMMETTTGEIKAIVNMIWSDSQQRYRESQNIALTLMTEPGSTFKTASLMAAIDDGYVHITDSIDVGTGICHFYDKAMKDHNYRNGAPGTGYGKITVQNALEASSNVGISQLIVKHYGRNPEEFVNKLYKMGLNDTLPLQIHGAGRPYIRSPKDKKNPWYGTTLPWMSIGYEVQIPPIYTLTFYNAIANNGKMISPLFVKKVIKEGEIFEEYKSSVVRNRICSDNTLTQIKTALEGVVWSPHYATAKAARSPHVKIAGKTGTAQISQGAQGYRSHQVSFCGYFPIENPQYTCLCVIRHPGAGHYPSGGRMSGSVVKEIAEKTMAIQGIRDINSITNDSNFHYQHPLFKRGLYTPLEEACEALNIPIVKPDDLEDPNTYWARMQLQNDTLEAKKIHVVNTHVPSVYGMGARDAIYAIEQTGMKAHIHGYGRVVNQSIAPGTIASKGTIVHLELK